MTLNKKYLLLCTMAVTLLSTSCKKYLDVNQDVNNPTSAPITTLITTSEQGIGFAFAGGSNAGGGLGYDIGVYTHQVSTRQSSDEYGLTGSDASISNSWLDLYEATLPNLDIIISTATAQDNMIYAGIAKILKAYTFSEMVDVWGDIPFSEYNQFKGGIKQPKFDDDATIYPKLLALLDEGIANIKSTTARNPSKPGPDDVIYKGNTTNWIKAANTIKLKLYVQLRKVQNVSAQVTALLASPSTLIANVNESFILPYGPLGATDDRNPFFFEYIASQRVYHVSPWFYEILKGINPITINYGITDPRTPYYIYNQIKPADAAQNSTDYRDGAFVSIYFGSKGVFRDGNQQNSISIWGIYQTGGKYDAGTGGVASSSSGTGAAPYRFLTYADRLYLEAELISAGVIPGNARTVFQTAMTESMKQVDYFITTYVKPTQSVPVLATQAATTNYIAAILANYDAGTPAKQLENIMTQKWLANTGSSVDQYTDYRRTGYPILFDPKNPVMAPGGFAQPPVNGNPFVIPQSKVPVTRANEFPLSLPYPQRELDLNANAPTQKIPSTSKIFWMP